MRSFGGMPVYTGMNTLTAPQKAWPLRQPTAFQILAAVVWLGLYQMLNLAVEALAAALPVDR